MSDSSTIRINQLLEHVATRFLRESGDARQKLNQRMQTIRLEHGADIDAFARAAFGIYEEEYPRIIRVWLRVYEDEEKNQPELSLDEALNAFVSRVEKAIRAWVDQLKAHIGRKRITAPDLMPPPDESIYQRVVSNIFNDTALWRKERRLRQELTGREGDARAGEPEFDLDDFDLETKDGRRDAVRDCLAFILAQTKERKTKTQVWQVAGYQSARQFQTWQRGEAPSESTQAKKIVGALQRMADRAR